VGCVEQAQLASATANAALLRAPRPRNGDHTRSWYHAHLVRAAYAVFRLTAATLFTLQVCAACAPPAQGPLAGASDAWAKPAAARTTPPKPPQTWDAYASALEWPALNPAPFIAHGHQPEQAVDVRVSADCRGTYRTLVTDTVFPDGCVLAQLATSADGPGYGMRKLNGSWTYFQLGARGGVLAAGALPSCAGCHAQAPADHVFGLPREIVDSR